MMLLYPSNPGPAIDADPLPTQTRFGATVLEYVFAASLIITVCMAGIGFFGSETQSLTKGATKAINKSLTPSGGTGPIVPIITLPSEPEEKETKDSRKDKDVKTKDGKKD